jgi:ATP-dependent Lon protease
MVLTRSQNKKIIDTSKINNNSNDGTSIDDTNNTNTNNNDKINIIIPKRKNIKIDDECQPSDNFVSNNKEIKDKEIFENKRKQKNRSNDVRSKPFGNSNLIQMSMIMPIGLMLNKKKSKKPNCSRCYGIGCEVCEINGKNSNRVLNNQDTDMDDSEYNYNNDNHDDDMAECDCEGDCDCDYEDDKDDEDSEEDDYYDYMNTIKKLKTKISTMKLNDNLKDKFRDMLENSNLDEKRLEWFDTLTKIPFGEYSKYEVDIENIENTKNYIKNVYNNLENSVWGMNDVKEEILNYVTQCIVQPDAKPRVLALCGKPGIGKTKIVREGISKSLNREMRCFSMGGIKDSSTFFGFDYTYVGSKHGAIVQSLIDCKTMNPILFFDELDKISNTKDGQDIENLLIHLTDPIQNYDFNDKYFNGIPIDISKSLLIFSFNEIENISPILRDRLHIINIPNPSVKDKINIASKFFVKDFLNNFKLNESEVVFNNDVLKYIIERYTDEESGVRKLRRCIETVCMKINTNKLLGSCVRELNLSTSKINIQLPVMLTKEHIDVLLYVKDYKNDKIPFMYI